MRSADVLRSIAGVSGVLVQDYDITGVMSHLLAELTQVVGADAAGVIVVTARGELELLASTSHAAADLETYQTMAGEGPCVEGVRGLKPVTVPSIEDARQRWPGFAGRMEVAGYRRAHAAPMRWQGTALGGLNLFWKGASPVIDEEVADVAQLFADILTIAVINEHPLTPDMVLQRVQAALEGRTLVERAKGVLAHQESLDMAAAFDTLLAMAAQRGQSVSEVALLVVDRASHDPGS